ncbi:hypothetical protein AVEN_72198-1 [Araneus ventricosus]|uniref:DUF5641 domain-containing protein n=1 Tax=Araneus ventricosus TaxID=182803 RepID=A0A4Y2S8V7_ARAVE|nr:hypothetical protein AVEN_72198-1 [Araneus ventricosus]
MCYLLETREENVIVPSASLPENRMKDVAFFEIISFDLAGALYLKGGINNLYSEKITSEYLGLLIQRNEHKKQGREIKHGEVVLIGSDNAKCIDWLLGFAIELLSGKDGVSRLVRLRTSKGELLRAIQRIFPFEVSSSWFKDCQKETKHENANNEVCNDTAPVIVKIKKWEDCKTTSKT